MNTDRLDIQDYARRLRRHPGAEDHEKLEKMRHSLGNQLGIIDSLRQRIHGAGGALNPMPDMNDPAAFDDLDNDIHAVSMGKSDLPHEGFEEDIDAGGTSSDQDVNLPEFRILPIPSAIDQPLDHHRKIEMRLRERQADTLLTSLRELIAEKSFHYSHILRLTKGQSMRSRARCKIARLNAEMSLCCRAYIRCRTAMIRLQTPDEILKRYQPLTKSHIRASTALVDPNRPGFSTLRLSWIWQTHNSRQDSPTDTLTECMAPLITI
jgi:hypothetical protein